jgi:hypothetical protein
MPTPPDSSAARAIVIAEGIVGFIAQLLSK